MATAYSSNLALALPVTGELSGTWGTTVNTQITNMLDEALGYQAVSVTLLGPNTLTIPDGTTGVARSIYIQLNGTGGGTVTVPTAKTKMYFVFNNTAAAITFKVTGQTGVSIPAAAKMALFSNGTDIFDAENYFSALTLGAALPVASGGTGITSFGTGVATWLGTPSSANLAAAVTDETGSGALVFGTSPTFTTSVIGGATMAVFNTASTTVNAFGAATTLNIGAATGTLTVANTTLAAKAITASTTLGVTGATTLSSTLSLGGTVSGGGNQINNVIIGTTTPLAGAFTTLSATGITTLSAATTPLLLSGAGSSSTTLSGNYAIRINASVTAANYGGIFFDGSTVYDSFFGRVPTALSGINDGVGYVTYASGAPTLRTLFSSTGLAVTGTLSATTNIAGVAGNSVSNTNTAAGSWASWAISNGTRALKLATLSTGWNGTFLVGGPTIEQSVIYTDGNIPIVVGVNSLPVGQFSSTGLAVTGTLSTTSNVNVNSTGGTIGVYVGPSGSEASFVYNTNGNLDITPRSGFTTNITAGGLAVTGTLSATGAIVANGAGYAGGTNLATKGVDGTTSYIVAEFLSGTSGYGSFHHFSDSTTYNLAFGAEPNGAFGWYTGRYNGTAGVQRLALSATGTLSGGTSGTGYSFSGSAPATSLTLDASGQLGVGTATPRTKFDVLLSGTANTGGSLAPSLGLFTGPGLEPITDGSRAGANVNIESNTAQGADVGASLMFGGRYVNSSTVSTGFGAIYGAKENGTSNNLAGYLAFYTNNSGVTTKAMTISSAGNLGLGVTPSAWSGTNPVFEFGKTSTGVSASLFQNGVNDTWFSSNAYFNGTNWIYKATGAATQYHQSNQAHEWYKAASGTAGNPISFGDAKMTLDASGNLLVGTTTSALTAGGRGVVEINGSSSAVAALKVGDALKAEFYTDGTDLFILNDVNGAMRLYTNGSERARFNSTGALVFAGGTTTADGIGITFPATQSASTNANTLDDYEEGTWTPVISGQTSGSCTMSSSSGTYTKIGNVVYLTALVMTWTAKSTLVGNVVVSGLPFASGGNIRAIGNLGVSPSSSLNFTGQPVFAMDPNSTSAYLLIRAGTNNDYVHMSNADINSSGTIYGATIIYTV